MNTYSRRWLFWTPRALCLAFAVFLSVFALDVFQAGYGPGKTIVALFIHLVPVYIVLAVLAMAWRWEWVGAAGFAGLALWYAKDHWRRHPDWALTIAGPMVVLAALFLVNWLKHDELRAKP
jgi:lysylphosphatidylglycerol synthetase-like protein (DUF2156 family)